MGEPWLRKVGIQHEGSSKRVARGAAAAWEAKVMKGLSSAGRCFASPLFDFV